MEIFAIRDLYIQPPGGATELARLEIFQPVKKNEIWRCHWCIEPLNHKGISVRGEDKLDSILRAICAANDLIAGSVSDGYLIWWNQLGDIYEENFFAIINSSRLKSRFNEI